MSLFNLLITPYSQRLSSSTMALVNVKSKREADNLVLIDELKVKLISKQSMTVDFYSLFVRKSPLHNSLSLRELGKATISTYDSLVAFYRRAARCGHFII